MKVKIIMSLIFLLSIQFSLAQTNLETTYVRGTIKIVKPSLKNIMRLCDMSYSDFLNEVDRLGYEKRLVKGEIFYEKGSSKQGGMQYISKTQEWVTYTWAHLDNNTTILDNLEGELEPYYVGTNDRFRVYGVRADNVAYEINISSNDKSELVMARRKVMN